jgi:hypothetical protein
MLIRRPISVLALFLLTLFVLNCGVKGDPLPPERPAELGRGRPTYRRAAERVKVIPQPKEVLDEDDEEADEETEE